MTYYEILEVNENASKEVIHMAYKALCKKYHPDICRGDKKQAEEQMKKINEAYATLSDETKRKQYDAFVKSQTHTRQYSHYQPKQESNVISIDALLKRGFMSLEDGEWSKANHFFELVLNQDAGHAEAYLGKLMVELRVKTKDTLKDCSLPFNDKINYKRAFSFADDSLKRFLNDTIQFINNRNYEAKCSAIYIRACTLMQQSNDIQGYKDAIAEFEKVREYKDSNKKIEECYEKIAKINSAILAAEAEKQKRTEEKKKNLQKNFLFIKENTVYIAPLLVVIIVAMIILQKFNWNSDLTIDNTLGYTTSNITTTENVTLEDSSTLFYGEESNNINSLTSTDVSSTNSITSTLPTTSTPSTSKPTTTSASNNSIYDKPAIFGSGDELNIKEGDFCFKLVYTPNAPIDVILTKYNGTANEVNIPSKIKGYAVLSIGESAFAFCNFIDSISIPNCIINIGDDAFSSCTSLTQINIPNSVITIGNYAFANCLSLTDLQLPNSVKNIKDGAFFNCVSLKTISIPNSISKLNQGVFHSCSSLSQVKLPNSVTSIASLAFAYCESLTAINIPSSVKKIDEYSFVGCKSLKSLQIPNGVTYIGMAAFYDCSSLTSINIPKGITIIDDSTFSGCSSLTSVTIPEGVTEIFVNAFKNCTSLTTITLPNSVTYISEDAFSNCKKLKTVYFKNKSQKNKFSGIFDSTVELKVLE